MCLQIICEHQG